MLTVSYNLLLAVAEFASAAYALGFVAVASVLTAAGMVHAKAPRRIATMMYPVRPS